MSTAVQNCGGLFSLACCIMARKPTDRTENYMEDKIKDAYEASKNIYDDVLTQGNFFSRLYIKLFWSGTDDALFDIVLSMNGFHAFPDKEKAFRETWRVLKPGGKFIACFYIKGKSGITDSLVKNVLSKKGWFTPPFQTEEQLTDTLNGLYTDIDLHVDGSMVYFCCTK